MILTRFRGTEVCIGLIGEEGVGEDPSDFMIVSFKTSRAVLGLDIVMLGGVGNFVKTGVDCEEFILTKNPENV